MISYWGVEHGDEVSKSDYNPNRSFRAQGLAYDKPGARKRAMKLGFKTQNNKKNVKTSFKHLGAGTAGGAGTGAAIGALATRGNRRAGAAMGGAAGGYLGALGGAITGSTAVSRDVNRTVVAQGLKTGDIVRRPKNEITAFGGTKRR